MSFQKLNEQLGKLGESSLLGVADAVDDDYSVYNFEGVDYRAKQKQAVDFWATPPTSPRSHSPVDYKVCILSQTKIHFILQKAEKTLIFPSNHSPQINYSGEGGGGLDDPLYVVVESDAEA